MIDDSRFMTSMTTHHSIAINNGWKASISDTRVWKLADKTIDSQVQEIAEMKLLLDDIDRNGERDEAELPPRSPAITPEMEARTREAVR